MAVNYHLTQRPSKNRKEKRATDDKKSRVLSADSFVDGVQPIVHIPFFLSFAIHLCAPPSFCGRLPTGDDTSPGADLASGCLRHSEAMLFEPFRSGLLFRLARPRRANGA